MREALAYVDALSKERLKEQRKTVRRWALQHDVHIRRFYQDPIRPRHRLPELGKVIFSCRWHRSILLVAKSHVLMRSSRFIRQASQALRDGVMICSADLENLWDLPPELNSMVWAGFLATGEMWMADPKGGVRDGSVLTDDEDWAWRHVPILWDPAMQSLNNDELAVQLNLRGVRQKDGSEFDWTGARRMRKTIYLLAKDLRIV